MSLEHPVSAGIFKSRGVTLVGWGKPARTVGINSFGIKTLCKGHNERLSVVDDAGILLMRSLEKASALLDTTTIRKDPVRFHMNGRMLERWFLKSMVNLFIRDMRDWHWPGGNAPNDPPLHIVRAVYGMESIPYPNGLYDLNIPGRATTDETSVGLMGMADREGTFIGGRFDFRNLLYIFWLGQKTPLPGPYTSPVMFDGRTKNIALTYHNRAGLFQGQHAKCEFLFDWPGPSRTFAPRTMEPAESDVALRMTRQQAADAGYSEWLDVAV